MADEREERIASLRAELAELEGDTVAGAAEALNEAETEVVTVAEEVQDDVQEAHETTVEAEHQVEEAVHEQAQEVAEEVGHPELAEQVAEHLFTRLHERGILPHTQHHEVSPVSEGEEVVHDTPAEVAAVPAEVEAEVQTVADTAPEPQHWYFRPVRFRRR